MIKTSIPRILKLFFTIIIFIIFCFGTTFAQIASIVEDGSIEPLEIAYPGMIIKIDIDGIHQYQIQITSDGSSYRIFHQTYTTALIELSDPLYDVSTATVATGMPGNILTFQFTRVSNPSITWTQQLRLLSACDYMALKEPNRLCINGSVCRPSSPSRAGYCECNHYANLGLNGVFSVESNCDVGNTRLLYINNETPMLQDVFDPLTNRIILLNNQRFKLIITDQSFFDDFEWHFQDVTIFPTASSLFPVVSASSVGLSYMYESIPTELFIPISYNTMITFYKSSQIVLKIAIPIQFISPCRYVWQTNPNCRPELAEIRNCIISTKSCAPIQPSCQGYTATVINGPWYSNTTSIKIDYLYYISPTSGSPHISIEQLIPDQVNSRELVTQIPSTQIDAIFAPGAIHYSIDLADIPLPPGQWRFHITYPSDSALSGCVFSTNIITVEESINGCNGFEDEFNIDIIEPIYPNSYRFMLKITPTVLSTNLMRYHEKYPVLLNGIMAHGASVSRTIFLYHYSVRIGGIGNLFAKQLEFSISNYDRQFIQHDEIYRLTMFLAYRNAANPYISMCPLIISVPSAKINFMPIITPISAPFIFNYHQYYAFRIERFGSIQRRIDSLIVTDESHNGEVYSPLIVQSYRAKVYQPFIIFVPAFNISYTSYYTIQLNDIHGNFIGSTESIVISHICPSLTFYTVPVYITPFTNIAQFLYHDSNFYTPRDEDYLSTGIMTPTSIIEYPPFNYQNGISFEVLQLNLALAEYHLIVLYKSPVLPNEQCEVETPFQVFSACAGVDIDLALPNGRTVVTIDEIISGIPINYNHDTLDVNSFTISDLAGSLASFDVPLQLPLNIEIDPTLPSTLRIKLAESVDVSTVILDSLYIFYIQANIISTACSYSTPSLITIVANNLQEGIITIHPSTLPRYQLAFTKDLPLTTTNPLILTNSIQLQVGYNFTINGDVNFLPNIKANITLQYYPLVGQNEYSIHPITIITQSITNLQSSTTLLTIPTTTHTTHRAEIVIQYNNSTTNTIMTLTTIPFSILSSCYISPTTITSTTIVNDWSTTCNNNNSICLPSGQCSSPTTIPPINNDNDDDISINHCSKCISTQTMKCDSTTNNQCQCQTNFIGQYCEQLQQCQEQTQLQCGNNGYITYDPITLECNENDNNKCQCYNYWIGNKCQQCGLQCLNNGKRYINCDKCGCEKGYSGEKCQCQTNIGSIILNGYSEIYNAYQLILNKEKDLELKSILLYELKDNADTLLNNIIITLQQLLQLESIQSIKLQLQQINNPNYTNNSNNNDDIDDDDDDDNNNTTNDKLVEVQYYTTFKLTMQFNCDGYNSNLSLDELLQRWESLQLKLLSSPIIQQYFIFSTNSSPQLEITELQPIDDTLPAADEEYKDAPNNAIIPSLLFNFDQSLIFTILLVMILFYQM